MGDMAPQPLVVLTGPPGAGKTSVARRLVVSSDLAVHVRGDDFWRFIETGSIPPYLDGSQHQNRVVVSALGAAAAAYAAGGYFTVLDAVVGPWLLPHVVQQAQLVTLIPGYLRSIENRPKRPEKELMTQGAERILRWSFLAPLICLVVVVVVAVVSAL